MIRTLVEIQGGRVSIRETAAETTVTVNSDGETSSPTGPLYKAAVDAERELVTAQRQVADLEGELASATRHADALEQARAALEKQLGEAIRALEYKVVEYDRDRTTERDRADQNKAWAERAEANGSRLSAALVEAEKDRDRLAAQIGRIKDKVHSPSILIALRTGWPSWSERDAVALANAVRNVRREVKGSKSGMDAIQQLGRLDSNMAKRGHRCDC